MVVLVAGPAIYLATSDLSEWRGTIAGVVSKALDRELDLGGELEIDLGPVTRVHATQVSMANADWGSEAEMATIDRLDAEIELRPLLSGAIHIPSLELEGGRAIFESDEVEGSNWALGEGGGDGPGGPVRLRIDSIRAHDVGLMFRAASAEPDWEISVAQLDSTGDPAGSHQLSANGRLNGANFAVGGTLATLESLVNLEPVDHDVTIQLGSNRLSSAGRISDPANLSGLDIHAELSAADPRVLTALLGLPDAPVEAFTATASARPESGLTAFRVAAGSPVADLEAEGTIDSMLDPGDVELGFRLDGPDIRPIAALFDAGEFPELPFSASGRLRWQGFPVELSDLEVTVGDNRIKADGRLGTPPRMLGTDFRFEGAGPDIAALAALAGQKLPREAFEIGGQLLRVENGFRIDDVSASVGSSRMAVAGFVGDPPGYADTDLELDASGPDLSWYSDLVDVDLPSLPYRIAGRMSPGDGAIGLHGFNVTLGDGEISVEGGLATEPGMIGTDLHFEAVGIDALQIGRLLGHDELPSGPLRAAGRITIVRDGYRLQGLETELAGTTLAADGVITRSARMAGSRLQVRANGSDASIFDPLVAPRSMPAEPFSIDGTIELDRDLVRLSDVDIALAGASATLDGVVGLAGADELDLTVDARGPSLAAFETLIPEIGLPSAPFSASGSVSLDNGVLGLERAVVELAGTRLEVDGVVALDGSWIGSEARLSVSGRDLGELGGLGATMFELRIPRLPEQEFAAAGDVRVEPERIQLSGVELALGAATATANGVVGTAADLSGTNLELRAEGPDLAPIATIFDLELPNDPFSIDGRVRKAAADIHFDDLRFQFGELRAELDGALGLPPKLVGTDLAMSASGPDLSVLRGLTGIGRLPPLPFEVSGRFAGDPSRFTTDDLSVRIGSSDVGGTVAVDLESKPVVSARLTSRRIDLSNLGHEEDPPTDSTDEPDRVVGGRVLSDEPLNLSLLERADGSLEWTVDELSLRLNTYRDLELAVNLDASRLEVAAIRGTGSRGGVLQGAGSLTPVVGGYRVEGRVSLDDALINLGARDADPSRYTEVDASLDLDLSGASPHELMAAADGRFVLSAAGGVVRESILDLLYADVLVTILKALNPFARATATNLNCAVLTATFTDGVMSLDPAVIQTDAVTILGNGTVDFSTEKLTLDWVTKPRKGFGLSASAITNSYIRLGGTLADPNLEVKPLEAAATTGVAVASMGISLVAKSLWDRITAEKKVCQQALRKASAVEDRANPK